ncbi:MAG: hypothetical protein ACYTFA_10950 [Planctomycetota bacterium]
MPTVWADCAASGIPTFSDGNGVPNPVDASPRARSGRIDEVGRPLGDFYPDCDTDLVDFAQLAQVFRGTLS